jgi:hypothetical protein
MGGAGGAGGTISVDAGTFNLSNTMSSMSNSAAGIMSAIQNSGINSMLQTAINVQSNVTLGR